MFQQSALTGAKILHFFQCSFYVNVFICVGSSMPKWVRVHCIYYWLKRHRTHFNLIQTRVVKLHSQITRIQNMLNMLNDTNQSKKWDEYVKFRFHRKQTCLCKKVPASFVNVKYVLILLKCLSEMSQPDCSLVTSACILQDIILG